MKPIDILDKLRSGADCRRRQVGAIVLVEGRIAGLGWNGLTNGSCRGGDCPRGLLTYEEQPAFTGYENNCRALHAEIAALRAAGPRAEGATLLVTCEPCPGCASAIKEAGIAEVVIHPPSEPGPAGEPR